MLSVFCGSTSYQLVLCCQCSVDLPWSYIGATSFQLVLCCQCSVDLPPTSWSYVVSVLWIYLLPGGLTLAVYLPNQLPGGSYLTTTIHFPGRSAAAARPTPIALLPDHTI